MHPARQAHPCPVSHCLGDSEAASGAPGSSPLISLATGLGGRRAGTCVEQVSLGCAYPECRSDSCWPISKYGSTRCWPVPKYGALGVWVHGMWGSLEASAQVGPLRLQANSLVLPVLHFFGGRSTRFMNVIQPFGSRLYSCKHFLDCTYPRLPGSCAACWGWVPWWRPSRSV